METVLEKGWMNPNKQKRKNEFIFHSILVRSSDEKNQSISVFEEFMLGAKQ